MATNLASGSLAYSAPTPYVAQPVTYVLSRDEYLLYGLQSVAANISAVHTSTSVDLQAVFTSAGPNPGQRVVLIEKNVTYDSSGFSQRAWYITLGAPVPTGSPF